MLGNDFPDPELSVRNVAWRASAPLRRCAAIGLLAGLISAGVGSRLVMKIIALADPSTSGVTTDASATVGEFTADGTVGLLVLGAIAGLLGGLVYLGLRRWLPGSPAWHGLAFGLLSLSTIGHLVFDKNNVDFQIFEPVLLTIALFAALFLANGLIVARLADRFHPEPAYSPSRASRPAAGVMAVICGLGLLAMLMTVIDMVDKEGNCLAAVGGGNGCRVAAEAAAR
jgi:hypothetical protein